MKRRPERGHRHESDVLLRQLDGHVAGLRLNREDARLAEQVAAALRRLVTETASASAADRARVRAAVHFFMLRRDGRGFRRPLRGLRDNVRVVNELLATLGRDDLAVRTEVPVPEPA
ncbi:MAG TPA: hypothetical protein VJT31_01820 [Rugosimonospora sp.]|nr:hypothetical protein [Rugosimonospora sp.]